MDAADFSDRATALREASEEFRDVLTHTPAVLALNTRITPPRHGTSIHVPPADVDAEVMVIERVFSGRALLVSLEPQGTGGWCLGVRDFDREQLRHGTARRSVLIPLRALPDFADAVAEVLSRASALYRASSPDDNAALRDDSEAPATFAQSNR